MHIPNCLRKKGFAKSRTSRRWDLVAYYKQEHTSNEMRDHFGFDLLAQVHSSRPKNGLEVEQPGNLLRNIPYGQRKEKPVLLFTLQSSVVVGISRHDSHERVWSRRISTVTQLTGYRKHEERRHAEWALRIQYSLRSPGPVRLTSTPARK